MILLTLTYSINVQHEGLSTPLIPEREIKALKERGHIATSGHMSQATPWNVFSRWSQFWVFGDLHLLVSTSLDFWLLQVYKLSICTFPGAVSYLKTKNSKNVGLGVCFWGIHARDDFTVSNLKSTEQASSVDKNSGKMCTLQSWGKIPPSEGQSAGWKKSTHFTEGNLLYLQSTDCSC